MENSRPIKVGILKNVAFVAHVTGFPPEFYSAVSAGAARYRAASRLQYLGYYPNMRQAFMAVSVKRRPDLDDQAGYVTDRAIRMVGNRDPDIQPFGSIPEARP